MSLLLRILRWLGFGVEPGTSITGSMSRSVTPGDPGAPRDPYAWKPAPVRSGPKSRSGAVAVAEPDE